MTVVAGFSIPTREGNTGWLVCKLTSYDPTQRFRVSPTPTSRHRGARSGSPHAGCALGHSHHGAAAAFTTRCFNG